MKTKSKKILIFCPLLLIIIFSFAKIYAVDLMPPTGKVTYSTDSTGVTVTITAREKLKEINGWKLSEDKQVLTQKFSKITSGTKSVTISDIAGNTSKVEYSLDVSLDVDLTKGDLLISAFWGSQVMTLDTNSTKRDKLLNKANGLYASNDGITWKFLGMIRVNNRDAAVMYKDGVFYATATTTSVDTGEIILDIFKSTDLINWTTEGSSAYTIPLSEFENKYVDSTGSTTKKTPLYSTHVRDNDTWVSATILTWGSKWFKDSKGNYYIVLSITDTSVDYRNHNYFTPYIIPIESFGTTSDQTNLETKNIKFKKPILVNLLDKTGKEIQTISDYSERTSNLDYGHIGINLYEQNGIYYLFTKKEATNYSDGKLQVYYSNAINGSWTEVTDNIEFDSDAGESPNICIEKGQYASHFEGNYPIKLSDGSTVFLTDHYITTTSSSTFNNYDTREGGMYYSKIKLSSASTKGSNPKPISILNTEMWKSSYKNGSTYTDKDGEKWTLKENVLRNATIYKVTSNDARNVIKAFASKTQFSISYNDGYNNEGNEISKTVENNVINISNVATNSFTLKIISNRPLKGLDNTSGWKLESDEVTLTKTFTSNESETVTIEDKLGNKTTLSVNINIAFVTATFANKDNKNFSWSGSEKNLQLR